MTPTAAREGERGRPLAQEKVHYTAAMFKRVAEVIGRALGERAWLESP